LALQIATTWWSEAWDAINNAWNGFCGWLSDAIKNAWDALYAIGRGIMDGFTNIARGLVGAFSWLWEGLRSLGEWLWQGLSWLGTQLYNALYSFGEWLINGLTWAVNQIADFFVNAYNTIRDAFVDWASSTQDWYIGVVNTLVDRIERITLADMTLVGMWKGIEKFAETGRLRHLFGAFASPFVAALASGVIGKVIKGSAEVKPIPRGTPIWPLFTGAGIAYTPTEPERAEFTMIEVPGARTEQRISYTIRIRAPITAGEDISYTAEVRPPVGAEETIDYSISITS